MKKGCEMLDKSRLSIAREMYAEANGNKEQNLAEVLMPNSEAEYF